MPGKRNGALYSLPALQSALRVKVKLALNCGCKVSPTIKISMPFEFNGGLKAVGVLSKTLHEDQPCWHFRGLNVNGDCGSGHCRLQPSKG